MKTRFTMVTAVILLLFAPTSTSGQKITPEQAMLARVFLKYQSFTSLSQRVRGIMKVNAGGATFNVNFTTHSRMQRPKQFRSEVEIDLLGNVTKGVSVSDGQTLWDFDPEAGEYAEQPLTAVLKGGKGDADQVMDRAGLDFPLMLFLDLKSSNMFSVKPGAEKSIKVKNFPKKVIDGIPMHVVRVPIPAEKGRKAGSAYLYVGAKDLLIRRCRFLIKTPPGKSGASADVEFICYYSQITPNAQLPPETFTFAPPETAKKMDKLAPVFDRAFDQPEP